MKEEARRKKKEEMERKKAEAAKRKKAELAARNTRKMIQVAVDRHRSSSEQPCMHQAKCTFCYT